MSDETPELTPEEELEHKRWTAVALCCGFNELAKQAKALGEKVYCRLRRDSAEAYFIELGGKKLLAEEEPLATLEVQSGMPCVRFRKEDIELMRRLVSEHDELGEVPSELLEARQSIAWLRNQRATVNMTNACCGDWDRCWCDDCEKRRLLKKSGKPFSNYEVFDLTIAQVKEYIAASPAGGTDASR